ncbi:hypothetical protein TNCV_4859521 [Trichonephila clavipes]|nr:hypothetical protein TNCV_4859521 [Trichonephila clavipes]
MATPGSSFTPTPLGHEDNLENLREDKEALCRSDELMHVKSVEAQSPHVGWCGSLDNGVPTERLGCQL